MSDMTEWLKERRTIHDAAVDISEGAWFACRYQVGAGNDLGDPDEIVGTLNAKDYATAIVDAHNTLPTALCALEKVLELHQPINGFVGDPSHWECNVCGDERGPKPYPCPTVRSIEGAIK